MAKLWAGFEKQVVPADAGPTQRQEMKRAFYAGAWALLGELMKIDDSMSDADGAAYMSRVEAELRRFNRDVQEGRA